MCVATQARHTVHGDGKYATMQPFVGNRILANLSPNLIKLIKPHRLWANRDVMYATSNSAMTYVVLTEVFLKRWWRYGT